MMVINSAKIKFLIFTAINGLEKYHIKAKLINPLIFVGYYFNCLSMKRFILAFPIIFLLLTSSIAQKKAPIEASPRLVVGIMVDQMRWDYLFRFQSRYGEKGFKRILREGFSCDNTFIPYAQTATAAGHATVYTGSVPAINGIVGNDWYDRLLKREVYCVEDDSVFLVGSNGKGEPMSPKNLTTTTITDELKLATNFRSKVIGIAIKDRGSILPAGHTADAAFWYDASSGNFVSSSWYMKSLSPWAKSFNDRKMTDSLYKIKWSLSSPLASYVQSDLGNQTLIKNPFPRNLEGNIGKNYGAISSTPWGNTLTLAFSKAAIESEQMGADSIPDFLAISLSSPDYIGHTFGPNSVEIEDTYLKLDQELGLFFDYLDKKIGKGKYTFFMTADHAVAHVPAFMNENRLPAKSMKSDKAAEELTMKKFGLKKLVEANANYQYYLDKKYIDSTGADLKKVKSYFIEELNKLPEVLIAFDNENISASNLPNEFKEMFIKGFNHKLGGDIQVVYKSGYFFGGVTGTTHGSMYPYDSHIPLLWMGWGIKQGNSYKEVYMTDIASTLAALLHIQMPSGNIGKVITEAIK
jgi:predicted AlkP superfamily pyrophosphatase or phosphodiesterase